MDQYELVVLRRKAGLKQWELAGRLGVCQTIVGDMERGRRPISAETEQKIRQAIAASAVRSIAR